MVLKPEALKRAIGRVTCQSAPQPYLAKLTSSSLTALLQPCCPPGCPGTCQVCLPQGLCTCCSSCLEHLTPWPVQGRPLVFSPTCSGDSTSSCSTFLFPCCLLPSNYNSQAGHLLCKTVLLEHNGKVEQVQQRQSDTQA